jgi:hypothetical protein
MNNKNKHTLQLLVKKYMTKNISYIIRLLNLNLGIENSKKTMVLIIIDNLIVKMILAKKVIQIINLF